MESLFRKNCQPGSRQPALGPAAGPDRYKKSPKIVFRLPDIPMDLMRHPMENWKTETAKQELNSSLRTKQKEPLHRWDFNSKATTRQNQPHFYRTQFSSIFRVFFPDFLKFSKFIFFRRMPGPDRPGPAWAVKKSKKIEKYFSNSRPGRPARITEFPFYGSY